MFDINKVNIEDFETLMKVFTYGIASYDYELTHGKNEMQFVSVTISRGDRKYRHNSKFDKAFLCGLETMFYEIYKCLMVPDPEIEYKKRRYYLYSYEVKENE